MLPRGSVSNGKCTKRKQNVQNICYSQNTRCFTLCSKSRVYEIHFVEKINTLFSSWSELFLKKILKLTYSYFLAYFTFFDYFLKSLQLYRRKNKNVFRGPHHFYYRPGIALRLVFSLSLFFSSIFFLVAFFSSFSQK